MPDQTQAGGDVAVLSPSGRLDSNTSKSFESELIPVVESGPGAVVVDLSNLQYVSSAGLRVLLVAAKRSKAGGGRLALSGMSDQIREVFDISGFSAIFTIFATRDEAVAALR